MTTEQTESTQPKPSRNELRRARMRAVVLGIATLIAILGVTYGQIQRTEAEKNLERVRQSMMEAEKQRDIAVVAQENASMLTQQLSGAIRLLEECQKKQK